MNELGNVPLDVGYDGKTPVLFVETVVLVPGVVELVTGLGVGVGVGVTVELTDVVAFVDVALATDEVEIGDVAFVDVALAVDEVEFRDVAL